MRKKNFIPLMVLFMVLAYGCNKPCTQMSPVDYVNPYMGNISHLLVPTYPTIHLPNSMLRVYPEREDYTSDKIKGLPIIVTSHRGKSAFNLSFYQGEEKGLKPVYHYCYDREKITPYSYTSYFEEEEVASKFAPGRQSAVYELSFEKEQAPYIILSTTDGELAATENTIYGYQHIDEQTKVYLYMETSALPVQTIAVSKKETNPSLGTVSGKEVGMAMLFAEDIKHIGVRYGVSFIDVEQAKANLRREISDYSVDKQASVAKSVWNETLGKIKVDGMDEDAKTIFYTSLYRTYERMICLSEDGRYYSAFDNSVHSDATPFYTDDWIWDTYRATHPLRVIIEPEMETHMVQSFVRMAEQMDHFWMPTFPEVTGDSRRMNSNHGVATVIDAHIKGITGFDLAKAYEACKKGITEKTLAPWSGIEGGEVTKFYWEHGYFPGLATGEKETAAEVHSFEKRQPVAVTLGTAYDEWCLAQIAKQLGYEEDYSYFLEGSKKYRNIFNHETGFFHPKDKHGKFVTPFDYITSGGLGAREAYGENNGWVYRWDVPHNVADLIELMGGNDAFRDNLEAMYNTPLGKGKYAFYAQLPDHTGNVGQFSMANEPSMHIPYLYNYIGEPWRTQKRIHTLLGQWFRNDLMGIPGDEDGGGMSAFVVFSMIGFYPVTPGLPVYVIGSPTFEKVSMELGNGRAFEVIAHNYSPENKYIQSATLNGKEWNESWFEHKDLMKGGKLEFVMGNTPNKQWAAHSVPPSFEMNSHTNVTP